MNEQNFLDCFYERVPAMREMVEYSLENALVKIEMSDGIVIVWGLGILPCVIELLKSPAENDAVLQSLFDFIEEMVTDNDETRRITFSWTFNGFENEEQVLPTALALMRPETKKLWETHLDYLRQFQLWKLSQMGGAE